MTELNKPVRRRTRGVYNVLYPHGRKPRSIVIELKPGDVIEFREAGRRTKWELAIDDAFAYIVRATALASKPKKKAKPRRLASRA